MFACRTLPLVLRWAAHTNHADKLEMKIGSHLEALCGLLNITAPTYWFLRKNYVGPFRGNGDGRVGNAVGSGTGFGYVNGQGFIHDFSGGGADIFSGPSGGPGSQDYADGGQSPPFDP
jgi:hypothetical protein